MSRPMSNIDIRALLGVPKHANQHRLSRLTMEVHTDELRIMASAVEDYTDELIAALEAAEKRIAELSHHLQSAHAFIEHTEAFGREASNGILCCGDAQWNIDESKSALAAAGKGEAS
ncbi:hypothetical protein [Enterobacter hormaechei]|uniref:hypothetical protein n=1 Tax=Enterobacter hormaechei TaxID=158836 RepID=UPI001D032583|nr:hypothetical protein [Enterobacter hormaechei]